MSGVHDVAGDEVVQSRVASERPVLGICVGMQVLYETGDEHGVQTAGIGVLPGRIETLIAPVLPHMGWNTVDVTAGSRLFAGVEDERFYFVHSFAARPAGAGESLCTHGESTFVAAVERGVIAATQFHPEKSGDAGLHLLHNWVISLN